MDGKWKEVTGISREALFEREKMLPRGWIRFQSRGTWMWGMAWGYPTVRHIQWWQNR